jgi:hypothetical protein
MCWLLWDRERQWHRWKLRAHVAFSCAVTANNAEGIQIGIESIATADCCGVAILMKNFVGFGNPQWPLRPLQIQDIDMANCRPITASAANHLREFFQ